MHALNDIHRSRGEQQQMLVAGRALKRNPQSILLDQPLGDLAPIIVEEPMVALTRMTREEGHSAILSELNAKKLVWVTDRAAVFAAGRGRACRRQCRAHFGSQGIGTFSGLSEGGPRRAGQRSHQS